MKVSYYTNHNIEEWHRYCTENYGIKFENMIHKSTDMKREKHNTTVTKRNVISYDGRVEEKGNNRNSSLD